MGKNGKSSLAAPSLSRGDLLGSQPVGLRTGSIYVPEWDRVVHYRELAGDQLEDILNALPADMPDKNDRSSLVTFMKEFGLGRMQEVFARTCVYAIVDEDTGELIFSLEDIPELLARTSPAGLARVGLAVMDLSGMREAPKKQTGPEKQP